MAPTLRRTPRRSPRKSPRKKAPHVTIQRVLNQPMRLKSSPKCVARLGGPKTRSMRATPAANAKNCIGLVRKGQSAPSGKSWKKTAVYIALPHRQRNASYVRSGGRSTRSSHMTIRWTKLYDAKNNKPLTLGNLPRGLRVL